MAYIFLSKLLLPATSGVPWCVVFYLIIIKINIKSHLLISMQLLLAPAINWTNLTKYQCILENSVIIFESCTWEFLFVMLFGHFLWADLQNCTIFISSSNIWNSGQTSMERMFSKFRWLHLWFSILCHHKRQDHQDSRFKIQEGFYLTNNCYKKIVICQY